MKAQLILNGRPLQYECEPTEMLLTLLEREGCTSARATCGLGVCGACTVLVDGVPMSGCLTLAAQAAGCEVTTAEGLSGSDPVVRAFASARAFQCGWCTPGFLLTVRALLDENRHPDDAEIAEALGGNLCRCGCYVRIADAVRAASRELRGVA
jgi:aerobic-type carbon monoxide dehydrogenase small subunit (CoxS/CutS family)